VPYFARNSLRGKPAENFSNKFMGVVTVGAGTRMIALR
jgi:hypothetical protein